MIFEFDFFVDFSFFTGVLEFFCWWLGGWNNEGDGL
jgi:hypothetical protein